MKREIDLTRRDERETLYKGTKISGIKNRQVNNDGETQGKLQ